LDTVKEQEQVQKRQRELLLAIESKVINIKKISDTTYTKLRKTEQVLLHAMFDATEVAVPTSFIISAVLLRPAGAKDNDMFSISVNPEHYLPDEDKADGDPGEEAESSGPAEAEEVEEAAEVEEITVQGKKAKLTAKGKKAKGFFEISTSFFSSAGSAIKVAASSTWM
jgi:hypothetical protein